MKLRLELNPVALLLLVLMILLLMPDKADAAPQTLVVREENELERRRRKQQQAGQTTFTGKKRPWETAAAMKQRHEAEINNVIDGIKYNMGEASNG